MRRLVEGWRRVQSLRRGGELESGLDEEIRFHIERQTEKSLRAGMSPDEARRQALIRFGGVERARESARDEFRFPSIEDFLATSAMEDARCCARQASRSWRP